MLAPLFVDVVVDDGVSETEMRTSTSLIELMRAVGGSSRLLTHSNRLDSYEWLRERRRMGRTNLVVFCLFQRIVF
jgi:hypothetical protein